MTQKGVHLFTPASACGALLASLLLMIWHHIFYRNLEHTAASNETLFDFEVSQQQINIAVSTAFAFLAKARMVIAISIAFVQVFWRAASARAMDAVPLLR